MNEPRRGPLHVPQERHGAVFVEWQGWLWAHHFGDPVAEHVAVRTAVGVWDVSPLRAWELRGSGAAPVLEWLFTNVVTEMVPAQIRYGLFCQADGAIINDATLYRFGADRFLAFTSRDADGQHLLRHCSRGPFRGSVTFEPVGDSLAALQVQGPRSRKLLADLGAPVRDLPYYRFLPTRVPVGGVSCWVSRIGYSGELGYELFCDPGSAERLWIHLLEAGARPYGFAAVETLRIESGLLLLGADFYTGRTNPFDVSLGHVVRLDKGDFLGRSALAKIADAPPRRLVTLELEGRGVPEGGARVWCASREVGAVTSACRSPTLGKVIALASLTRSHAREGTKVAAETREGIVSSTVRPVPIYDPRRRRPRA